MRSLTWPEVWAYRLARHYLAVPAPADGLVEVVREVGGIHAQVMAAAELSLGLRVEGITRLDVRAALWERRRLVKTYGLRGTVHLFPADELPLWLAAFRQGALPDEPARLERLGLSPDQLEAVVAAIGEALDGRRLSRDELGREVVRRAGDWAQDEVVPAFGGRWPRWTVALGAAAYAGALCFGPNLGSKVTFVRPDQWLGSWREVDGRAALAEVVRRYLAAFGPATPRDFAQWFRAPLATVQEAWRRLAGELEEVDVEGWRAWLLKAAGPTAPAAPVAVRLLPHFDCYLIGCHPRDRLVPGDIAGRALFHGGIGPIPLLVVDGVVAGIWQHRRAGTRLAVRVDPSRPLTEPQRWRLDAEARRIGEIWEANATLEVGAVEARPHL